MIPATQYREIFLSQHPIMDCRAPVEFLKGAMPSAVNHPLMLDSEREQVGTCYKKQGQAAALALGHQLVSGQTKQQRIDAWISFVNQNPNAYISCFRGGMRSSITQQWINEAGLTVPFIEGGYKGMRQYLIDQIENLPSQKTIYILSGITGSGKTDFLTLRNEAVDLEGIANHRGSSFGKKHDPQPTQINFENQLAVALLRHEQQQYPCLLLEDESYLIGRNALPKSFYEKMQQAEILVLEESNDNRLTRLLHDYVIIMHLGYVERLGEEQGMTAFRQYLEQSFYGIQKRLGGKALAEMLSLVNTAINKQISQNNLSDHLIWIEHLLKTYYDPMYHYQLEKKADRIRFRGNHAEMHQWLDQQAA